MNNKNYSVMPVLDEQVLLECKSDVFNINEDYNLNGKLVTVPKGQTFKFAGGSLNNGIIRFDDTFLEDVAPRSIDLQTEGTITNEVVKMSWFADVNQVRIAFSNQVIEYDQDETINTTVVIPGNNLTYDGMGNTFTCNETFFSNQGKSNIIIRNFNTNANTNKYNLTFYEMPSIENVSIDNIQIYNNVITGFMIGISLNNDTENGLVNNSFVYNNHIFNCPGSTSGSGYGIHMANVRNSIISGNEVVNCGRHAIYHAYGENNIISNNEIKDHCKDYTIYNLWAALEIGRKSRKVIVKGNTFLRCNNVCLLVYSPQPSQDGDSATHLFRYGVCEGIVIEGNTFNNGNKTGILGYLPYIYIGYEGANYSSLIQSGTYVADMTIIGNTFSKILADNMKCIQVNQCQRLTIADNTFLFGLPYSPQLNEYLVIDIPTNRITGYITMMTIFHNTFTYSGPGASNIYLLGPNMSLVQYPSYVIKWLANTLNNQIIGGITRYSLYKNTAGSGFINYD